MSTTIDNLWPDDITSDDVLSPQEILRQQADQLAVRTNSILTGHVARTEADDRINLCFEVYAPRIDSRVMLFSVQHRKEFEYPAAIIPPDEGLPTFLEDRYYEPSVGDVFGAVGTVQDVLRKGRWVKNEWVATSPTEFTDKVGSLLSTADVKSRVLSLISRSNDSEPDSAITDRE